MAVTPTALPTLNARVRAYLQEDWPVAARARNQRNQCDTCVQPGGAHAHSDGNGWPSLHLCNNGSNSVWHHHFCSSSLSGTRVYTHTHARARTSERERNYFPAPPHTHYSARAHPCWLAPRKPARCRVSCSVASSAWRSTAPGEGVRLLGWVTISARSRIKEAGGPDIFATLTDPTLATPPRDTHPHTCSGARSPYTGPSCTPNQTATGFSSTWSSAVPTSTRKPLYVNITYTRRQACCALCVDVGIVLRRQLLPTAAVHPSPVSPAPDQVWPAPCSSSRHHCTRRPRWATEQSCSTFSTTEPHPSATTETVRPVQPAGQGNESTAALFCAHCTLPWS